MEEDRGIVAFIPVRGGSKSIPKKNIKLIAGKPLIQWILEAAANSVSINAIFVSTDSEDIKSVVQEMKLPKVNVIGRSAHTASDYASSESALLEFAENFNFKSVFFLQATNPMITTTDLEEAYKLHVVKNNASVISVVSQQRFIWRRNNIGSIQPINYSLIDRPRRQEFEGFLVENGAFYLTTRKALLNSKLRVSGKIYPYIMDEYSYFEVDEPKDWEIIEYFLLQRQRVQEKNHLKNKLSNIGLFLTDVDGVLTDSGMYYSEKGDELKKFNTHDGMGFQLLKENGIKTGIISSEITDIIKRRAEKLKVDFLFQGKSHDGKLESAKYICDKLGMTLENVAYIGDDINCKDLLLNAGIAACPSDAVDAIKQIPNIICLKKSGGNGVVREFVELILSI